MGSHRQVEVPIAMVVAHTDKALLVRQEDGTEVWVPVSRIREFEGMLMGEWEEMLDDLEIITIPDWIAPQKGLV